MTGCTPEPGAPGRAAQDRAESTPAIPRDLIITPLSHSAGVAVPSREIPPDWARDAGRRGKPRRAAPLRGSRVPRAGFLARWVLRGARVAAYALGRAGQSDGMEMFTQ